MQIRVLSISRLFLSAALISLTASASHAQTAFPAAPNFHGSQQVTLGNSAEALMGPWKFRLGDDLSWAQANFNDSAWEDYTLKQQGWSETLLEPRRGRDAGWAGHGHRGTWGHGWYRIHIDLPDVNGPLTLLAPVIDSAYTVYWDGQELGHYGDVARQVSYAGPANEFFSIPVAMLARGTHVLAFRVWDRPLYAVENLPEGGGLRGAPLLVQGGMAAQLILLKQRTIMVQRLNVSLAEIIPFSLIGVISLLLWLNRRRQREYLWIGLALPAFILSDVIAFLLPIFGKALLTHHRYAISDVATQLFLLFSLLAAQWLLELQRRRMLGIAILVAGGGYFAGYAALVFNAYILLSPRGDRMLEYAYLLLLPSLAVFLWMVVLGIRVLGGIALLMLSPSIMIALVFLWLISSTGHVTPGEQFAVSTFLQALVPVCVLLILAYRFLSQWREHQRIESELQHAHAVQSLLVPEHLPQAPGYRTEGMYLPASQVGGDFYQVLALSEEGFLVVLGDVSGKGLRAAMVVSMTVGALRAIVQQTERPGEILDRLNRELTENKIGGFVTCICARVDAKGTVTVANAGHLPPWVNGEELAMPGALPLGMLDGFAYEESSFSLQDGDTLTLMSDGIVEARREKDGQLYGFERLAALLARRPSAEEIARTAQRFGQEDDVSVVQVTKQQAADSPAITIPGFATA